MTKRGSPAGPLDFVFPPFPEESLTSWYVRLARANAISLHELATKLLGRSTHSIATTDLDANANSAIPDGLARVTGLPFEDIRLRTLWGWQHLLSAQVCDPRRATRWILSQRKDGSGRRTGEWTQACLQCLATDRIPYFRLHWRFAFITECVVHQVEMTATCPRCDQPLDFPRMDRGLPRPSHHHSLATCAHCLVDMRIYAQRQPASDIKLWRLQRKLLRGLTINWILLAEQPVWVGLFLDGIYRLLRCFRLPGAGLLLARGLSKQNELITSIELRNRPPLERIETIGRRALLRCVARALERWPTVFVELADRTGFTLSVLHNSPGRLPYWLERVGHDFLDHRWHGQSESESMAVATILHGAGIPPKPWLLREWLGYYVPKPRFITARVNRGVAHQHLLWPTANGAHDLLRQAFIKRAVQVLRRWCLRRDNLAAGYIRPKQLTLTY